MGTKKLSNESFVKAMTVGQSPVSGAMGRTHQGGLLVFHLAFGHHRSDWRHWARGRARSVFRWCAALLGFFRHFLIALFFGHGELLCEALTVTRYEADRRRRIDALRNL